jgi:hypothetical protein
VRKRALPPQLFQEVAFGLSAAVPQFTPGVAAEITRYRNNTLSHA